VAAAVAAFASINFTGGRVFHGRRQICDNLGGDRNIAVVMRDKNYDDAQLFDVHNVGVC